MWSTGQASAKRSRNYVLWALLKAEQCRAINRAPQIYEPLSHTGDLGMLVYGHDVPELFAHAAWAMFDLMSDATLIQPRLTRTMGVEGSDLEDLLVRWAQYSISMTPALRIAARVHHA